MSDRFKPSRAGVINIWDYVDEEWAFADGRLALRGHNGSGKTKALEVLFPFVLDGVADSRRLDPFSGETRTMKSNLLFRGQESEYGYVWMEFAQPASTVTLIIGMRAHRNSDGVRMSFFVTGKRLGIDFGLLSADSRPLTERQLRAVLEPDAWRETAAEYRDLVDHRLFGLGRERYAQLLDLLLALRRPLLAKDLDPVKVSDTLAAGLSPVDEDLVQQAARDFENLAAVQQLFDDLTAASAAVEEFRAHYEEYLRSHVRFAVDRVRARTDAAVDHAERLIAAAAVRRQAADAERAAEARREASKAEAQRIAGRLQGLKDSEEYKAQGRIEDKRREVAARATELGRQRAGVDSGRRRIAGLTAEVAMLSRRAAKSRAAEARQAAVLADAARRSGIADDGFGHVPPGTTPTGDRDIDRQLVAARARVAARREDIGEIRRLLISIRDARAQRAYADQELTRRQDAEQRRQAEAEAATARLAQARAAAEAALAAWTARWEPRTVTGTDAATLTTALESAGEPGAARLSETYDGCVSERRATTIATRTQRDATLTETRRRLAGLRQERDVIAAGRDDAPPATDLRPASRDDRPGAPLWQLVRFAPDVPDSTAAAIEGALYGAGLLTAWVHPDPALTGAALKAAEADGYLIPTVPVGAPFANAPITNDDVATARKTGKTLADVLVAEDQEHVPSDVIVAVLSSITLAEDIMAPGSDIPARPPQPGQAQPPAQPQSKAQPQAQAQSQPQRQPRNSQLLGQLLGQNLQQRLQPVQQQQRQAQQRQAEQRQQSRPHRGLDYVFGDVPAWPYARPAGQQQQKTPVISLSGQFSYGVHVGARRKERPEYIGASNRAARRRARLAALDIVTVDAQAMEQAAKADREIAEDLLEDLARARRELPDTGDIAKAAYQAGRAAALLTHARDEARAASKLVDEANAEVDARARQLRHQAAEHHLPAQEDQVEAVARAVAEYENAAIALHAEHVTLARAERDVADRSRALERQHAEHQEAEAAAAEARRLHAALKEEFRALEGSLKRDVQLLLEQIKRTDRDLKAAQRGDARSDIAARREHDRVTAADRDVTNERQALTAAIGNLHDQVRQFGEFTRLDLRPLLGVNHIAPWPESHWGTVRTASDELAARLTAPDPAGRAARTVEAAVRATLPGPVTELLDAFTAATRGGRPVTESTLKSTRDRMSAALKEFTDALAACEQDYRVDWEPGAVITVHVIDDAGREPVAAFARRIAEQVKDQGVLLEEREHGVLEEELLAALAAQIHGRVLAARDLTRNMNADTRSKPMSSGLSIGIRWTQTDKTDAGRSARKLLERDQPGQEDLAELRDVIREMTRGYRGAHPRATYREALAAVLDYRGWHEFELVLITPADGEQRLTAARHSVMSGGEKTAAIHLPLFAAANALYSSAKPDCPRLVAMDEAFVGIDERYKPDLFGLAVKFDLDLFMTGHDLWVTTATVPMIAHYDLFHDKVTRATSALLLLWDGWELIDSTAGFKDNEALVTALLGFRPSRHAPLGAAATLYVPDDEQGLGEYW